MAIPKGILPAPRTRICRKIGCPDLVESTLTRGQMICRITERIPGNMVACPKEKEGQA